jgi:O-antigen/teichoic acid export membrane protein
MSNEKSFLKHFAIIGGGTFLNLLFGLFTTPLITRIVDPEEYGQHSVFLLYANLALLILLLGMDQGLGRYYYLKTDKEYKRALLFRCVQYPFITTIIVAALVIVASITGLIHFEFPPVIMALLCGYTLFEVLFRFGLNVNRLEYNSKMYSALNIALKAAYVGLALPLLLIFKGDDLLKLCIASTGSAFVVLVISILSQKEMWNLRANNDAACTVDRVELMKYAFPLTITMGITYLFQALDRLSIKHFCTYADVGIYASTMSLVNIFAIIQTTFNTLWSPMATEHYINDSEDRTFYQKGNQIITVAMFFLGVSLILCKDVFALLLGEKYREAAYILPFLIFHPISIRYRKRL